MGLPSRAEAYRHLLREAGLEDNSPDVKLNRHFSSSGFDVERSAAVFRRQILGRVCNQPVEFVFRQVETFMLDGLDWKSTLQELLDELLTGHWAIGGVMVGRSMFPEP
jgi:hypothetical protein